MAEEKVMSLHTLRKEVLKRKSNMVGEEVLVLNTAFSQETLAFQTQNVMTFVNEIFRNSLSIKSVPMHKSEGENVEKGKRIPVRQLRDRAFNKINDVVELVMKTDKEMDAKLDDLGTSTDNFQYTDTRKVRIVYYTAEAAVYLNLVKIIDKAIIKCDHLLMMGEIDSKQYDDIISQMRKRINEMHGFLSFISNRLVNERRKQFPKIKNKEGRNLRKKKPKTNKTPSETAKQSESVESNPKEKAQKDKAVEENQEKIS